MNICMAGLDHSLAPIALRERMSFTSAGVVELNQKSPSLRIAAG